MVPLVRIISGCGDVNRSGCGAVWEKIFTTEFTESTEEVQRKHNFSGAVSDLQWTT
jgi:hypothetical protein